MSIESNEQHGSTDSIKYQVKWVGCTLSAIAFMIVLANIWHNLFLLLVGIFMFVSLSIGYGMDLTESFTKAAKNAPDWDSSSLKQNCQLKGRILVCWSLLASFNSGLILGMITAAGADVLTPANLDGWVTFFVFWLMLMVCSISNISFIVGIILMIIGCPKMIRTNGACLGIFDFPSPLQHVLFFLTKKVNKKWAKM